VTVDQRLRALTPPPAPDVAPALHAAGAVDVAYARHDSAIGPLLLAATPRGLARLAFLSTSDLDAELAELAARLSPRIVAVTGALDEVRRQIDDYLAGRRDRFALPTDLTLATGFRLEVLGALAAIPYGATRTYAEVAGTVGRPAASRAVGTACARNPIPLVIPCHRVVRTGGALGGYAGGLDLKRRLLDLEAA
jgi:methylated-DNA-[protein]-cysteine S-methyltransferase